MLVLPEAWKYWSSTFTPLVTCSLTQERALLTKYTQFVFVYFSHKQRCKKAHFGRVRSLRRAAIGNLRKNARIYMSFSYSVGLIIINSIMLPHRCPLICIILALGLSNSFFHTSQSAFSRIIQKCIYQIIVPLQLCKIQKYFLIASSILKTVYLHQYPKRGNYYNSPLIN